MPILEAIERAIERLSPEELAEFRHWFAEFEARAATADRLDPFATEALSAKGKLTDLPLAAVTDCDRWFAAIEEQTAVDELDHFVIEALRLKGK
ncbi:MAG: hypothetical protein AAFQ89_05715 [Cyanobacteria bacterium J06626_18]